MIVAINGRLIDLSKIYSISDVTTLTYNDFLVENGSKISFTIKNSFKIYFYNENGWVIDREKVFFEEFDSIKFREKNQNNIYDDFDVINFIKDTDGIEAFKLSFKKFRDKIVDLWKKEQTDIPKIDFDE